MRFAILLIPSAFLLAAEDDAAKKELARFEGTWVFTKYVNDGKAAPEDALKKLELTVKGNESAFKRGDDVTHGRYILRPDKDPKELNIEILDGPNKGKTFPAIYAFDGAELRICLNRGGKDRPRKFESEAGSKNVLEVLKKKP
jgi:uncharacterized protein (TIGR03067 family)